LGGTGFLGSYFLDSLGIRAVAHTTRDLYPETEINYQPLTFRKNETEKIRTFLEKQNCGTIVNCSALADIEKCESNPEMAYWMNCELPGFLSLTSKSLGTKFVHISTDAVFEGTHSFSAEEDRPSPVSVYGISKWEGEQLVLNNNSQSMVVRVNFFGDSKNKPSLFNFFYENLLSENT
jgi:dTDP-4-dehydrorhamnose reductase